MFIRIWLEHCATINYFGSNRCWTSFSLPSLIKCDVFCAHPNCMPVFVFLLDAKIVTIINESTGTACGIGNISQINKSYGEISIDKMNESWIKIVYESIDNVYLNLSIWISFSHLQTTFLSKKWTDFSFFMHF